MEIYLLRHGLTTQPGTYTGISDVDLAEAGRQQIRTLSPGLSKIKFDHCFCSPLRRCRQSFRLLDIKSELTIDENLQEINFGDWEGLSFTEVKERFPADVERWLKQGDGFQFPHGESTEDFCLRISRWFERLGRKAYDRVLVVSHGGVLRYGICHLLNLGKSHSFAFHVGEGLLSKVTVEHGAGRLEFLNRTG